MPRAKPTTPPLPGFDFESFLHRLAADTDAARLEKALAMLKADRFQLFAQGGDADLVGVVKSQSSRERVYACCLGADGTFSCGTQNLRPCGGLRGALCKHLLVLIIGLARAEALDIARIEAWVKASRAKKPMLDVERMSETFLKYKGAEAGEVDWRPTETIPEDYYAL